MGNQISRLDDVLSKSLDNGKFSEVHPDLWKTVLRVTQLHEEGSSTKPKMSDLTVIGNDEEHTIFALGSDGKPYVWDRGVWLLHG